MGLSIKRKKLAILIGASLASSATIAAPQDEGRFLVRMNVQGESEVPQWNVINHLNTAWKDDGAPYGCSIWSPDVSTIDWGQEFQQSRQCSQNQVRTATPVLFNPVLQTTKQDEAFEEQRTITVSQYQPSIGQRDYIDGESAKAWSAWTDVGGHYDCTTWTPDTDTVNLYDDFGQTRDCQQNQTRSRDVYHVWASGKETPKRVDTEDQTITEQEQRTTQGTKDYIYGERIGSWTSWADTGTPYSCKAWTPTPDTINLDQSYTQTRDCQQDQDSERNIYDVWRSGKETLNRVEPRAQTITVEQSRGAVGEKDFIASERIGSWTSWTDEGGHFACGAWSPEVSTIDYGESFTQTRDCSQKQVRERNVYDVWQSGKETLQRVDDQSQNITEQEQQSAIGTRDFITGETAKSWGSWSDDGNYYGCSDWSPTPDTVNLDAAFTQSRTCDQDQNRTRQVNHTWASGKETFKRTETDERTIDDDQSRGATGTKDYNTGTDSAGAWGGWSDTGSVFNCSGWSPSPNTVNLEQTFTQNRTCDQKQTRSRTIYDVWASGEKKASHTETDTRTIDDDQSRSATGTKDYDTGTNSAGNWGSWSDSGSVTNCSSWSPSPGTVNLGHSFTQSRTCDQKQTRSRTIYNVWASGETTVSHTETDTRTIDDDQSRSATGTKDYDTGTNSAGTWSSWSDSGSVTNCSSWSPSPGTVNLGENFTQSRTCDQKQTRSRTIYNVWASGEKKASHTETDTRTIDDDQSRSATGTKDYDTGNSSYGSWSSWSDNGSVTGCSSWSPSTSTVNLGQSFTQSRTCDQRQSRSRTVYNVWASGKTTVSHTQTGTRTIDDDQSRSATGAKDYDTGNNTAGSWSSWSDSGSVTSCSNWSPSRGSVSLGQSFTQTRTCDQKQTRTRTIYNVWASGDKKASHTETDTRTVDDDQSRRSTGTKDYDTGSNSAGSWSNWSNSGSVTNCSSWSPSASTVNLGQSFTQSRTCDQKQTRTRSIYNVWASGDKKFAYTDTDTRTVDKSQSRGDIGEKDYVTGSTASSWSSWSDSGGEYSCSGWSPSTSTVRWGDRFTQSQSCSQNQVRNRTIYNVWKSGKTTYKRSETDSRTISATNSRPATGRDDFIVGTSYGSWSSWSIKRSRYSCTSYGPSTGTVTWGQSFTQTRDCKRDKERTRTVYKDWASGKRTTSGTQTDDRTITIQDSRSAVGTKNVVTGTQSSAGSWSKSGGLYSCSSWSPSRSTVKLHQSFTQTRSCSQKYTRTITVRNVWADGSTTVKSTSTDSKVESVDQSRGATGTKDYKTGNTYGSWTSFSDEGSPQNCTTWSPVALSVPNGQTFTQSRTCDQKRRRTRPYYDVWKSGKKTYKWTQWETSWYEKTESRTSVGIGGIYLPPDECVYDRYRPELCYIR